MTRRAIRRDEEQAIRGRVPAGYEVRTERDRIVIDGWQGVDPPKGVARALAAVGIHPGADGWEIEEEAPAVKVGDLFRRPDGPPAWCAAEVTGSGAGGPRWRLSMPGVPGSIFEEERDLLDPARWTREAPAVARPPLPPGFGWYERGVDSYSLDGPNGTIAKAHHDGRSWTWSILSTFARTTARDLREAQERTEEACRAAGLFDAPTVTTDVRQGAGMGEQARTVAGVADGGAGFDDAEELLCQLLANEQRCAGDIERERIASAFVAALKSELRASLPAPPMPSPRTTDGALTAYLLEHHRDAWRPGEDALALAIRLLGEASDAIADTREEARVADESAKELGAELVRVRADLAKETERRVEAERGRGEALGDLAALRGGLRGLMAKMGAPHG